MSPVLDAFTGQFADGAVTAITGSSGSGKSTLLYLLALMLTPADGQVFWDGAATSTLRDGARSQLRAAHGGFLFQDALLDPARSVLDNVCQPALLPACPGLGLCGAPGRCWTNSALGTKASIGPVRSRVGRRNAWHCAAPS